MPCILPQCFCPCSLLCKNTLASLSCSDNSYTFWSGASLCFLEAFFYPLGTGQLLSSGSAFEPELCISNQPSFVFTPSSPYWSPIWNRWQLQSYSSTADQHHAWDLIPTVYPALSDLNLHQAVVSEQVSLVVICKCHLWIPSLCISTKL